MKKSRFPYLLFFALFLACSVATFFTATTVSVTRHTDPTAMIAPFPVALQLATGELQVVTPDQLQQLQLPDPEDGTRMIPNYLFNTDFFNRGSMGPTAVKGTSVTNGKSIHIPADYTAEINGRQLDSTRQEITLTYINGAEEDQIITAIYEAGPTEITPKMQFIKQVLIWKSIFMNGMMISLILPFLLCKKKMKHLATETESAP